MPIKSDKEKYEMELNLTKKAYEAAQKEGGFVDDMARKLEYKARRDDGMSEEDFHQHFPEMSPDKMRERIYVEACLRAKLFEQLNQAVGDASKYKKFFAKVWEDFCKHPSLEIHEFIEYAETLGLVKMVNYNPDEHGEVKDTEPRKNIFVLVGELRK